jgi:hypothetical protein
MVELRIKLTEEDIGSPYSSIDTNLKILRSVDDTDTENKYALEILLAMAEILTLNQEQKHQIENRFIGTEPKEK